MSTKLKHTWNPRKVYVFDGWENPIGSYETVTACAEALNVSRQAVTMAVSRASILDKKYYASYEETFTRQPKKKEFNPVRPPIRASGATAQKPAAKSARKAMLPSSAQLKAAAKRSANMALRSRATVFSLSMGLFSPFNSFN